ncbi:MAG: heme lyase CcmF/NrfE family subunit [Gammaproteobacteria bacterium]
MVAEIGQFTLIIALCLAIAQSTIPLIGAHRNNLSWMSVGRTAACGQFLFLLISFVCLTYCFVTNDFSVLYVANNSNTKLPVYYQISAVWGAHEGSLLLWVLALAGWGFAVSIFSRALPADMIARVLAVMGMIGIGFILFTLLTSNPFERLFPAAIEGRDLNPLLQDPGLVIHPPMLYMGYVGFSVAFAFAIAALLSGKMDSAWVRWSRPWASIAWVFLTIGIGLGSWWAYHELGWGGWWFWDPVENASFMPWLVGTALIHSLAVTEKRSTFKSWTILLSIMAFSLSLLGTFLVRSGVLVSVHSFASDPARGLYILIFLAIVVGSSLTLYAWRATQFTSGGRFDLVSKETMLLINNVLLVVAMITILVGTLYPLFLDALGLPKLSVGPPYFSAVFVPLMLPLVILMGIGPIAKWRRVPVKELFSKLKVLLLLGIALGIILPLAIYRDTTIMTAVGIATAAWAILAALYAVLRLIIKRDSSTSFAKACSKIPRAMIGMVTAHVGIGIFILGVVFTSSFSDQKETSAKFGEEIELAGYTFVLESVGGVQGPNYQAMRGSVNVTKEGSPVAMLYPEKRIYTVQTNPMTEPGIQTGVFRDLYVSLGEPLNNNEWGFRIYYRPFIQWVWIGTLLMALGGLLGAMDKRYRTLANTEKKTANSNSVTQTTSS